MKHPRCLWLMSMVLWTVVPPTLAQTPGKALPMSNENRGLWLKLHKDGQNTSRADLSGGLERPPRVLWSMGDGQVTPTALTPVKLGTQDGFLIQRGWGMMLVDAQGQPLWTKPAIGVESVLAIWQAPGGWRLLCRWGGSGVMLVDAGTGATLWRRLFEQGFRGWAGLTTKEGFRLYLAPGNTTRCLCFEWTSDQAQPRELWQQDYAGRYLPNFGPALMLADMDHDGQEDLLLASKPTYLAVIDSDTGQIKFDLRYPITGGPDDTGRPYGLILLDDLDHDGYRDVVVASHSVEEYLAVLKNEGGAKLRLLWSRFVEKDFPEDHRQLRVTTTSLADINGDGRPELVVSLFNMKGDGRWHTLALNPLLGDSTPLHDWPDRYLWGCYPLTEDDKPRVIVSEAVGRPTDKPAMMEALDGSSGRALARVPKAQPILRPARGWPWGRSVTHLAGSNEPIVLDLREAGKGLLVESSDSRRALAWSIRRGASVTKPLEVSPHWRLAIQSGAQVTTATDLSVPGLPQDKVSTPLGALVGKTRTGRELVTSWSDGKIIGGTLKLTSPMTFTETWRVKGVDPAIWIGADGQRVICALDPDEDVLLLYENTRSAPPRRIKLPLPPQRRAAKGGQRYQSSLTPFTAGGQMLVLVCLTTGTHTNAAALFNRTGRMLWLDRQHGVFPHPPAVYDLTGDGTPEMVLDDHGRQAIYGLDGSSQLFAQAWHTTVPGRDNGTALARPIIGPFGPQGQTRMVMAPGFSAHEVCDATGRRVARRGYSTPYDYYLAGAAIGSLGHDQWVLAIIHRDGIFEGIDVNHPDLAIRLSLNLGEPLLPGAVVVACDLDGQGGDEFLVGLKTGQLLALGDKGGKLVVLWNLELPAEVIDLIVADADGDGRNEIIVTTGDGYVRVLQ